MRLAFPFIGLCTVANGQGYPDNPPGYVPRERLKKLKGISYGPIPLKDDSDKIPHDDFFSPEAETLWNDRDGGRGDLQIISSMGANAVRLYGNHPGKDHNDFLMQADELGLKVIPGMSDYPFTQAPDNCMTTNYNCYKQIKASYKENLERGFLLEDKTYHPALYTFILLNEPDLKLGPMGGKFFKRGLISAFDAVLDAEQEVGVVNASDLKFTATMSFAVCDTCPSKKPALGQMLALRDAMKDPKSVGYKPKNDLWKAYKMRFENSMNTANPNTDMKPLFIDDYNKEFKEFNMDVIIGEYHQPNCPDLENDLKKALALADETDTLFRGFSFFEWQVRYDKGGSEMEFGMFGLGKKVKTFEMEGDEFGQYCLTPEDDQHGHNMPQAVANSFGGKLLPAKMLCGSKEWFGRRRSQKWFV